MEKTTFSNHHTWRKMPEHQHGIDLASTENVLALAEERLIFHYLLLTLNVSNGFLLFKVIMCNCEFDANLWEFVMAQSAFVK